MTPSPTRRSYDAIVVGGGLIGLACAWRSAQRGLGVLVVERDRPGAGASGVAAGMLAPVTEADFGESEQLRDNLAASERWPGFAAELEERSGLPTGYRRTGALVVAADRDDAAELRRLHEFQRASGLSADWLAPSAARRLEPGLSPRITAAIDAPGEAQADPAAVVRALTAAAAGAGAEILSGVAVESVDPGAVVLASGRVSAAAVVLAAGAWSAELAADAGVRPVKGQLLRLRTRRGADPPADRIVRTPRCYIVPRADGRVVIGATMEERGFDATPTAEAVFRLLEAAWEVLPDVGELEFEAVAVGLRPGTADNRPVVGRLDGGLIAATGHGRNGVLLAPLTADTVAALAAGDKVAV